MEKDIKQPKEKLIFVCDCGRCVFKSDLEQFKMKRQKNDYTWRDISFFLFGLVVGMFIILNAWMWLSI
jgi:hypothetical protein